MRNTLLVIPMALGIVAVGRLTPVLVQQALGQTNPAASTAPVVEVDPGWPRTIVDGGKTLLVYQPQVDRWVGNQLDAYAAVEATTAGSKQASYGVVYFTAETAVDKASRLVRLDAFHITRSNFPGDPGLAKGYEQAIAKSAEGKVHIIALDRLEANLAITREQSVATNRQLNNEPPRIILSTAPAILVPVDGPAELRPVPHQSNLQRVINTRALILFDNDSQSYSLNTLGGWFASKSLEGPWSAATHVPENYNLTRDMLLANKTVDLLTGGATSPIKAGSFPTIYVSTTPTELMLVHGDPQYSPIANTNLMYVSNTDSDIFMDSDSKQYYITISGRWFQAASLNGPWIYISGKDLPEGFAKIPQTSPKAGVLVSIPGTPQAQEAVIANDIPQTAVISRANAALTVAYDGDPKFSHIEGTGLSYVVNSSTPVILAENGIYYAVDKGVWYSAVAATGPWTAAESVPDSIYSIPPTCPIHYVTYVHIYRTTPDEVYCGYTPGYYGTEESSDGVVNYGTGYYYPPFLGNTWIGFPATYGFGASFGWNSLSGWSLDFGLGYGLSMYAPWNESLYGVWGEWGRSSSVVAPTLSTNGKYTPRKHIGFGGIASANIYSRLPGSVVVSPGQSTAARTAVSAYRSGRNNVYATREGQVYRYQSSGWQQRSGPEWRSTGGAQIQQLQRQQFSREVGGQRYQNFSRAFAGGGVRRR